MRPEPSVKYRFATALKRLAMTALRAGTPGRLCQLVAMKA